MRNPIQPSGAHPNRWIIEPNVSPEPTTLSLTLQSVAREYSVYTCPSVGHPWLPVERPLRSTKACRRCPLKLERHAEPVVIGRPSDLSVARRRLSERSVEEARRLRAEQIDETTRGAPENIVETLHGRLGLERVREPVTAWMWIERW